VNAPIDLNLLRAFAAVHAAGSFSAAAVTLGVPRSTVSRAVAALEEQLKQPLFQRTTRKVTTTPVGVSLFERVAPQLESLTGALFDLPQQTDAPSGTLRITCTVDLGIMVLTEVIARYLRRYPGTQVEVDLTARVVDMMREGFDLALRVSPKRQKSSSLIARKVGHVLFQLYASPTYLARRPPPRSLEEVSEHEWVTYDSRPFTLTHTRGTKRVVVPSPRVMGNDMMFQREALRAGCGLGPLPSFVADADVANGVLVRVLPDWVAISAQVLLVHPPQRHLPPKVSAFQQLLLEMLRQRPISAGVS
jgi:DNA-binding transcriptional LysR family regulator